MTKITFETSNVITLHVSIQVGLPLSASGWASGIVLNSGDGGSQAVPSTRGTRSPHAINRLDLRDATWQTI